MDSVMPGLAKIAVDVKAEAQEFGQCIFDGAAKGHNTPVIALVALPSHDVVTKGRAKWRAGE